MLVETLQCQAQEKEKMKPPNANETPKCHGNGLRARSVKIEIHQTRTK